MRVAAAIPVVVALAASTLGLVLAPARLGEIWRALSMAGAHGWQVWLVVVILAPVAMALGWWMLSVSLWPWTVALTLWLATLTIVAGRLHFWMSPGLWLGLALVVSAALACVGVVWSRQPRR